MATRGWDAVTPAQVAALTRTTTTAAPPKPAKYRNIRTMVDGYTFDSRHEARVYQGYKIRQLAGDIRDLRCQVAYPLLVWTDAGPQVAAHYVADFVFVTTADNQTHVVDAKSAPTKTPLYRLKKKWLLLQSGIVVEEV